MKRINIDKSRHLRKSQTDTERKLWSILRNRSLNGIKFRRQFPIGNYILDFYSPDHKLAIEADGGHHYGDVCQKNDSKRDEEISQAGIKILRFSNADILRNIDAVCTVIIGNAQLKPPHLNPLPDGERRNKSKLHTPAPAGSSKIHTPAPTERSKLRTPAPAGSSKLHTLAPAGRGQGEGGS
ncbi:MAG: hypothetical protein A2219_01770 [Elusimicrobia bacterium RIFOXYA2_FULL_50_26]|nr:MAG: hypothetical protein A2219_01770 [Elusimicrobia bacterium RIFOXYA2_FULL_50_26]